MKREPLLKAADDALRKAEALSRQWMKTVVGDPKSAELRAEADAAWADFYVKNEAWNRHLRG